MYCWYWFLTLKITRSGNHMSRLALKTSYSNYRTYILSKKLQSQQQQGVCEHFSFPVSASNGFTFLRDFRKRRWSWRLPRLGLHRAKRVATCRGNEPRFGTSRIEGPRRARNLQVHDPMIIKSIGPGQLNHCMASRIWIEEHQPILVNQIPSKIVGLLQS